MNKTSSLLLAGVLGAIVATPSGAQAPEGQFSVTTRGGFVQFGRNTSLEGAPYIGLDTDYGIRRNFSVGTSLVVGRPTTRPGDFLTTQTYGIITGGDTTLVYGASQAVSLVNGEVTASLRFPMSRFTPFITGGVGIYGMFLDPQTNRGAKRTSGTSATGGGGVAVRLSERAGLQFDVRSLNFFGYNRNDLDPTGGRNSFVTLFEEDFALPPERSKRVSSLMFTLGFRYIPGGEIEEGRDPNLPREDRR